MSGLRPNGPELSGAGEPIAGRGAPKPPRRRDGLPRRLADIISPALDKITGRDEARAYLAWARAVGDPVSGGTRPKAFHRGQLTVECASSVWANELTYLGPQILRRMDEVVPGHPVRRFRFVVGRGSSGAASRAAGEAVPPRAGTGSEQGCAAAATAPPGQGSGAPAAKKDRRQQPPALDALHAARASAEGVRNGRLRAAIEAALRRSSEGLAETPAEGSGGEPSKGSPQTPGPGTLSG